MTRILSLAKHLKSKKIIIVIIILAILGLIIFTQSRKKDDPPQTTNVERQTIKSGVSASGTLTGKETANLRFKIGGKLAYLNVKVGDQVTPGQSIAGLDTQDLAINLKQAKNTLRQRQAEVEQILDEVKNHDKDENFEQKAERTAAEVARDNAFDNVREARRAFSDASIYSPISGVVTKADPIAGQVVSVADVIVQIIDDSEIYFDTEVDEGDIGQISVGQKVEVNLNSFADRIFTGTITQIKPITQTTDSGATVVIARVLLDAPGLSMIANLNGQANIITNEKTNTLVIPSESLVDDNHVYVDNNGKFDLVEVKTGISSDTHTEILEGLNEGQKVVINPNVIKK